MSRDISCNPPLPDGLTAVFAGSLSPQDEARSRLFDNVKGAPAPGGQRIGKALPLTAIANEQKIVWG
jgi:hypothetical protein